MKYMPTNNTIENIMEGLARKSPEDMIMVKLIWHGAKIGIDAYKNGIDITENDEETGTEILRRVFLQTYLKEGK